MSEYYVYIDVVEKDGDDYNHLLHTQIHGEEYLISGTSRVQLGLPGTKVWLTWPRMECDLVHTVEQVGQRVVAGQVRLCTIDGEIHQ